MKSKNLQKKFSNIYSVLNFTFYLYAIVIVPAIIIAAIAFIFYAQIDFFILFSDVANVVLALLLIIAFLLYFGGVFFLLYLLRKVVVNCKNGHIFTEENKKHIQKLFFIFALFLTLFCFIISGGIFIFFSLIFLWVLYEIFFIAFDYKTENDSLKEENNLTI